MSTIIPFSQLFDKTIYRIPDYQRGYAWIDEQLEDLWDDLTNTQSYKNAFHFTGILTVDAFTQDDYDKIKQEGFKLDYRSNNVHYALLNGERYKTFNVVDGQQRMTTILILLSQLINQIYNTPEKAKYSNKYFYKYDNHKNKYLFGYHVDVPSYNYLINNIFEDITYDKETTETLYTYNLSNAKEYFSDKLMHLPYPEIEALIEKVTNKLVFSVLNLSEGNKNLDASMIFETLNFRGKQLSGLERFKNRVLYLLSKQPYQTKHMEKRRNIINKTWLEVYKWLGRNSNKPLDDDAFLKAFWLLSFSNSTMVADDFKAYQKNIFEDTFSLSNIGDNNYMKPDRLQTWLRQMRRSVKLWYFINNPYKVEDDIDFDFHYTPKIQRSLLRLESLPRRYGRYMINLVLAILLKELPRKKPNEGLTDEGKKALSKVEELLWLIERHNIMCFLLNGNNSSFNQENIFREISKYYYNDDYESLKNKLSDDLVDHFDWRNVVRNIHQNNNFHSWVGLQFVMREYEEIISGERIVRESSNINFIYPTSEFPTVRTFYQDINKVFKSNRDVFSYSLGNLFISNNTHSARIFEEHQDRIQNAFDKGFKLYKSEIELLEYHEWTRDEITKRGEKIFNAILGKWLIPMPEEPDRFYKSFFGIDN